MAKLLLREKSIYGDGSIMDFVVWGIPESEKYPDAVRYRKDEMPYHYRDIETLFKDFDDDVLEVRRENI